MIIRNMLIHYINSDYKDGDSGGVARFDHELHKVFPDMITVTKERKDLKKYIDSQLDTIFITDNGMCLDIPDRFKCIVVHHGCAKTHRERETEKQKEKGSDGERQKKRGNRGKGVERCV